MKSFLNLFHDNDLTFCDNSFNSFFFEVTFFSLLSTSVFFTKLAIWNYESACFSLAVKISDVNSLNSWGVIYLSWSWSDSDIFSFLRQLSFYQKIYKPFKQDFPPLMSIIFGIFSNIKCFITQYFIRSHSSSLLFKFSISYIMLKTSSVWFVLINVLWISSCFKFFILSLFFVNGPWAVKVNPGCLKSISGINLSPANKNLLTISLFYILYWLDNSSKTEEDLKELWLNFFLFLNYLIID